MNYAAQPEWRTIQTYLPEAFRMTDETAPTEEWWDHRGHRIHLDTYRNPQAPVKVILFHGVGTNGRQMSTILGRPLATRGYETIAIDMPTYGVTETAPDALVTYDDWVAIGSDLIDAERAEDDRPIVLYGLSAGGMETYHVAALNRHVAGIVGMTFLDQRDRRVRVETAFDPVSGLLGAGVMATLARTPLRGMRLPMRLVSKMRTLVNDRAAKRACYADKTSAGNSATVAFLHSYMAYQPAIEPEDFDICPVLLTQPAADRWTPLHLAEPFLSRIRRVPVTTVMLDNAGHYPLEQPGLDQMVAAVTEFCIERIAR
ncbi:alpha/beta fold hydrolase [Tsukamurella sp. 8F]|uniref:alpha/beta hydrolase n=1 Tax=unclassified Tsukamurella TaxID=2633480 RepID=UPI0023B95FEE|nr:MULTISPECIES: alpha/beta fold hydrolase [unclassified Tsukamurella]MDF0528660.1 alpha/beta fold hydrolase [Tsukamurella sp. 8J]MDF0585622.1 alpha/beta fold hydrolase [Tsukamurella sp. 8F]